MPDKSKAPCPLTAEEIAAIDRMPARMRTKLRLNERVMESYFPPVMVEYFKKIPLKATTGKGWRQYIEEAPSLKEIERDIKEGRLSLDEGEDPEDLPPPPPPLPYGVEPEEPKYYEDIADWPPEDVPIVACMFKLQSPETGEGLLDFSMEAAEDGSFIAKWGDDFRRRFAILPKGGDPRAFLQRLDYRLAGTWVPHSLLSPPHAGTSQHPLPEEPDIS